MSAEARTDLLPAIIEALLFVADRPLSVADLVEALETDEVPDHAVREALEVLMARHDGGSGRGFVLHRLADTWQFRTTDQVSPWLKAFTGLTPVKLSRAALETLAVAAYRQPCTRADVERVRGVDSGGILRALLDRKLLRVAGRRDEPGRPNVYATTEQFLAAFGLGSLRDLPSLREFTMLGQEDLDAVDDLMGNKGLAGQVTFDEYAARRALDGVDEAADAALQARRTAARKDES
ncbi:MAG: SMC-Scp complex subunit ScpB [Proteobacteria bacterium]|nr:SMC-Scp complex subunit ScpB [Pseudomonadota bacterium]